METELISVIVPVYNVERYLRRCVDSILHQTYQNLEVLLVDDGSTDASGAICDEYAAQEERVTAVHQKNGGLSAARNRMMEDQGTTYRIFQQCSKVAYRPVPMYYYYQRPDSILHRRNMKFYEDKLDMGYQKYQAIREAYPGMSENDAAMLSVVEHCYPYLMQDTERCAKMEAFLQECDPAAAKLLCTSSQRKYQLLRCSRRLYAKLFLLKNGPAAE